jgi:hypothetical protein
MTEVKIPIVRRGLPAFLATPLGQGPARQLNEAQRMEAFRMKIRIRWANPTPRRQPFHHDAARRSIDPPSLGP